MGQSPTCLVIRGHGDRFTIGAMCAQCNSATCAQSATRSTNPPWPPGQRSRTAPGRSNKRAHHICASKQTTRPDYASVRDGESFPEATGRCSGTHTAGRTPNQLVSERGGRGVAAASRAAEEPEDPALHCAEGAWVTLSADFCGCGRSGALGLNCGRKKACVLCAVCARNFHSTSSRGFCGSLDHPLVIFCLGWRVGDLPDSAVDIHRCSLPEHGGGRWAKKQERQECMRLAHSLPVELQSV